MEVLLSIIGKYKMENTQLKYLICIVGALLFSAAFQAHSQIAVPADVCKDQLFVVKNEVDSLSNSYWDFCEGDLLLNPVFSQGTSADFDIPVGISLIQSNGNWYGFICSLNNNSIFRLDFGPSLSNRSPQIVNLGNIGGLLSSPQDIEIVEYDSNYYAFVYNRSVNKLVRVELGNDIQSTSANATVILTGDGFTNGGLDLQFDETNWIVSITNAATITLVNLGDSPGNAPAPGSIMDTGVIPGINSIGDIKFVEEGGSWYAFVVGYSSWTLHRLYFGANLFVEPISTSVTSFQFSPYGLVIERDKGNWIMIVSTLQGNLLRLDFGSSLTSPDPTFTDLGDLGGLDNLLKIDIVNSFSRWFALSTNWNSKSYYVIEFPEAVCPFDKEASSLREETLQAATEGSSYISLYEKQQNGLSYVHPKRIEVASKVAPSLDFSSTSICENTNGVLNPSSDQSLTTVLWDLGPGGSSTEMNPSIAFTSPGPYKIKMEGLSENGCYNLLVKDVEIYPSVVDMAAFSIPPGLLCTNNAFTFPVSTPDLYDGNLSYSWYVDENLVSTDRDLQYAFTSTGAKDIRLITAIPGCSSEITKTTSPVEEGPVVNFSFTGICEDETFSFQNEITDPVESYLWDFGNSQTSTAPNPDQVFTTYGEYAVSLTAANAIGCQNVTTKTVTVHAKPLIDFLTAGPPNACSGTPTQFQDNTTSPDGDDITAWLWEYDDAKNTDPGTVQDPEHIFPDAGLYNVSLTSTTASGCQETSVKEITINQSPSTAFTHTTACDDVPVQFSSPMDNSIVYSYWEIGTAYYNTASPTHTFKSPGAYPLYLEVTAANDCTSKVYEVINVPVPLSVDFSYLKNCVDQQAVLTDITGGDDPVVSRDWVFNSGETFSGSPLAFTFTEQGKKTITLKVTAGSGCEYATSKEIEILPRPQAAFSAEPASGAYPLEVRFANTSSETTQYLWKFNDGTGTTSTEVSPVYTFNEPGSYDVELIAFNEQACEASFTGPVTTVAPLPDADIEMIALAPNQDGTLKLIVTIHNKGNTILRDQPLNIDFDGVVKLRQIIQEPILPASKYNFVFNTGIMNAESMHYLCVSIDVENDLSTDSNRMCKDLQDALVVFPAYPNPTPGALTVEWISEAEKNVGISLTDALGRTIIQVDVMGSRGLNQRFMDLSGLQTGIYYLLIEDGDVKKSQRIAVSGKP